MTLFQGGSWNSPAIGRAAVGCVACLGVLLFAPENGPKTAPPPRPADVTTRTLISRPDLIEVSIQLPEPQVIPTVSGGVAGDRIELRGSTSYTSDGEAELPIIRQFVAIPDCARLEIRVEVSDIDAIGDVMVRPPRAVPGANEAARPGHGGSRQVWARIVDIQHARGQALARIEVYPVRYDPGKREISSPREIRIQLKPVNPRGPVAVDAGPLQSVLNAVIPNLRAKIDGSLVAASRERTTQSAGQVCWCDTQDDDWEAAADYIEANCAADYLIIVADELLTDEATPWHGACTSFACELAGSRIQRSCCC